VERGPVSVFLPIREDEGDSGAKCCSVSRGQSDPKRKDVRRRDTRKKV